jgi:hypothetical protein
MTEVVKDHPIEIRGVTDRSALTLGAETGPNIINTVEFWADGTKRICTTVYTGTGHKRQVKSKTYRDLTPQEASLFS